MKLNQLKPAQGAKRRKKRVGRGNASGHGTYSGRGIKGQKSRSGSSFYPGFEGGRTPLVKVIPKVKGFKSHKNKTKEITISALDRKFEDNSVINKTALKKAGIIQSEKITAKLINTGETKKKFNIIIDKATKRAIKKIKDLGGTVKFFVSKEKNGNKEKE